MRLSKTDRPRVRLLDGLRGLSLVSMATWHTVFDLVYIFGISIPWFHQLPSLLWAQTTCWCFILIAGACLNYGQRTLQRGLMVFGCALMLTLVTYLFMPELLIRFGILHMMGCCMLLAALIRPLLKKIPWGIGFAVCALLFVFLYSMPKGAVGFLGFTFLSLPSELYSTSFLFPIGLPSPRFASGDYFPLIPWIFLFFTGYFGFRPLKKRKVFAATKPGKNPLEFMGRHSLIIYLLHQPVILGILLLLQYVELL